MGTGGKVSAEIDDVKRFKIKREQEQLMMGKGS